MDDSDVATGVNYGVASSSSWSKSAYNPKKVSRELEGPQRLLPPFKGEQLEWRTNQLAPISTKGQALRFLLGWLSISHSIGCPHYDRVDHRW